jgi:acyl carrier protein
MTTNQRSEMTPDATKQTILAVVTDAFVGLGAERDEVTSDATLEALDIDSLDLAELAQIVEEQFGVKLAASDVTEVRTVGDVVALIEARV